MKINRSDHTICFGLLASDSSAELRLEGHRPTRRRCRPAVRHSAARRQPACTPPPCRPLHAVLRACWPATTCRGAGCCKPQIHPHPVVCRRAARRAAPTRRRLGLRSSQRERRPPHQATAERKRPR